MRQGVAETAWRIAAVWLAALLVLDADAPAGAAESCWSVLRLPAEYETVTEQRLVVPERRDGSGRLLRPAEYHTLRTTRQVRPAQEIPFRVVCPAQLTTDLVASLQRALAARGYFAGAATGRLDEATRAAIRAFQDERGVPSDKLALATAQLLGLLPYDTSAAIAGSAKGAAHGAGPRQ